MDLILRVPSDESLRSCYIELVEALTTRTDPATLEGPGIEIPPETAIMWINKISEKTGLGNAPRKLST
jgi:hypothetical protein